METRILITLKSDERAALTKLALNERREPRQQAAFLICQQLESLGLLQPQHRLVDTRAKYQVDGVQNGD